MPEFEFRFNALDDVHAEDVLWADIVLGNAPVSMICQNKHIEWFQSNSAGPDAYLKPGVLPENCMVTNATGAYGLAISEWMLAHVAGHPEGYVPLPRPPEPAPVGSHRPPREGHHRGAGALRGHGRHRLQLRPPRPYAGR